jgi:hypothetical protein
VALFSLATCITWVRMVDCWWQWACHSSTTHRFRIFLGAR